MRVKAWFTRIARRHGKVEFLRRLPHGAKVLDVGCGNHSPMQFKTQRPDLWYIGLDIGDYNQTTPQAFADEYIITDPAQFAARIRAFESTLDAVVSAHNLEHCQAPDEVMDAMLRALRPGGRIYLAFPSEASLGFPHRAGTLNFRDDDTHVAVPNWDAIIARIRECGLVIDFAARRYRSLPMLFIGLALEPVSAISRRVMKGTWDLYGFESVVWARRPGGTRHAISETD